MKFNLENLRPFFLKGATLAFLSASSFFIYGQQVIKRPTSIINQYFEEVQYQRSYSDGTKAFCFTVMQKAFPNSSYTDILADLEQLLSSQTVQDRFLYVLYRDYNRDKLEYALYATSSKDAQRAQIITNYCYKRFNKPYKVIQDLKIAYDKIEQKARNEQRQAEAAQEQQHQDSLSNVSKQLEGTKQNLTLFELLEFVKRDRFSPDEIRDFMKSNSTITWEVEAEANDSDVYIKTDISDDEISYDSSKHTVELETSDDDYYAQLTNQVKQNQAFRKTATYGTSMDIQSKVVYKSKDYIITFVKDGRGSMGVENYVVGIARLATKQ